MQDELGVGHLKGRALCVLLFTCVVDMTVVFRICEPLPFAGSGRAEVI